MVFYYSYYLNTFIRSVGNLERSEGRPTVRGAHACIVQLDLREDNPDNIDSSD